MTATGEFLQGRLDLDADEILAGSTCRAERWLMISAHRGPIRTRNAPARVPCFLISSSHRVPGRA